MEREVEEKVVITNIEDLQAKPNTDFISAAAAAQDAAIFISGGTIVNDDHCFEADLLIQDSLIKEIGTGITVPEGAVVVDAKGKLIIPGGIDMNTHFQLPFMGTTSVDDFFTGTKAALSGGTTMIVDCVWDSKGTSLLDAFEKWRGWADGKVACDYSLAVGVTWWSNQVSREMTTLATEKGVSTFRVSQEYNDIYMLNDGELLNVFKKSKELKALTTVLAENGYIIDKKSQELISLGIRGPEGHAMCRSEEVEAEATQRAIVLANQARCPVSVVPVTSKTSAKIIADSRRKGNVVFGAPSAASLGADGTHYWNKCWRHAAAYVTAPPLRPDPTTPMSLMDLLSNGDLQYSSSSHCTFNAEQKAIGKDDFRYIPHGVNGVEERMSLIWDRGVRTGRMDACRFVAVTSSTPAKILNIYPQKGRLAVGSDADVVVWDPEVTKVLSHKTHVQACDFNIFEGLQLYGAPVIVISNGRIVLDSSGLNVQQGAGRYIPTPCNSVYVYGRVNARDQSLAPQRVDREAYSGQVAEVQSAPQEDGDKSVKEDDVVPTQAVDQFHRRPPTRSGGRNLQESSFSFSGDQIDDSRRMRPTSRVLNPPGGRSHGLW